MTRAEALSKVATQFDAHIAKNCAEAAWAMSENGHSSEQISRAIARMDLQNVAARAEILARTAAVFDAVTTGQPIPAAPPDPVHGPDDPAWEQVS